MTARRSLGIRTKLIAIFVFIKVLPLVVLAWVAWSGIAVLGESLQSKVSNLSKETQDVISQVSTLAVDNSIRALDLKSRENIERLSTDTARSVAAFLYDRDDDIRMVANMEPTEENYKKFLTPMVRNITTHVPWVMNQTGDAWEPSKRPVAQGPSVVARNPDNSKDFHYRPPSGNGIQVEKPLYLEMTFVDLQGNETIKITTSNILSARKKMVADPANTYCKAEQYFSQLKDLSPGEIYVSEVVGAYVKSPIIGPFTERRAIEKGIPFKPEDAAYAGKENPVGKRFQGLIRWATPVVKNGKTIGWVTLALDHTHVMEFTDHIVPTAERYTPISNAGSGNYAFMWDYKDRNISHPRDYFIVAYDPETGQPALPWLEDSLYKDYEQSGLTTMEWEEAAPIFQSQALYKKPSPTLTKEGFLGLDCRYLNFAPQCEGWNNLTRNGGSGSFVIFWSGLWKLTTAAAIPYHTGIYKDARGFGFVTIGANVFEFHKAATETGEKISSMAANFEMNLAEQNLKAQRNLKESLNETTEEITVSTLIMVVFVILIAIWMASTLTNKITNMIKGIRLFQGGDMEHRLEVESRDEVGQLTEAFNEMSDDMQNLITDLRQAETKYRGFFENATQGIFRTTIDGELLNANPAFAKLFGFSSSGEMLSTISQIGDQLYVDPHRRQELIAQLEEHGTVRDFEFEVRHTSGQTRSLITSCYWVPGPNGEKYLEGVATDITERKLAIKTLRESKDKAEQLSLMKSNFLSMVSHEFRTPLTSIIGFAKLIRKYLGGVTGGQCDYDEAVAKCLNRIGDNTGVIITEGDRLTELINNVLDLAKLEAGQFEWDFVPVSMPEVVGQSLSATRILFDNKDIELASNIDPELPVISGDHDRLVQVCINLLANAAKFTEEGRVFCEARVDGLDMIVRVIDSGIGVPVEEENEIFDKFRQLGNTLTDKPKGTGLGLPICKEIVEYHGGKIWYEPAEGGGSIFAFSIPLNCPLPKK